jgi:NAD(P)-dependent dehydrogenase (short-subunit alcohol dehydrogenase family)
MSKTIVITGTSTGFGKLTAKTLAQQGFRVIATMRSVDGHNKPLADELKAWADTEAKILDVVELDVTSDESVAAAAKHIEQKYGEVDVVVNNAGIYNSGVTESYSIGDFKKMYEVNVFGSLRVVHAFLPGMRRKGKGLFIQVSSIMGRFVIPFNSAYTSSKWAIEAIAESLRYELSPLGIDSVIVQPGAFKTELFHKVVPPSNYGVLNQYAATVKHVDSFSDTFNQMMSGDIANQPQHVADAILQLVNTPAGERPLRVTVDKMMTGLAESVNDTQLKVQEGLLSNLGLTELLQTKPELMEVH